MRKAGEPKLKPPAVDDPILDDIVCRLVEVYHPERVYLFGSTARGAAGPHSDYDIMVVVPDGASVEARDTKRALPKLWGIDASIDVLVWTRENFDGRLHLKASLPSTIVREGRLLYAA